MAEQRGKCTQHARTSDKARGSRQSRGYDQHHDELGRDYQRRMDAGERFDCWRCGTRLGTVRGRDWTLGHDDHDRTVHRGPECPRCQYATAGRRHTPGG